MFGTYRTLLAVFVVIQHLGGVPSIGSYAVFGFYILSGYLMTFIMQNNYGYSFSGVFKYGINRALRIYPLYWISIIISIAIIWLLGETYTSDFHESIVFPKSTNDWIKNIFILFPDLNSSRFTPPAWALTVEIFFYILIGLGLSRNKKLVVIWLLISIAYHLIALIYNFDRYFSLAAASLPFATGAFIFFFKEKILSKTSIFLGQKAQHIPALLLALIITNWYIGYSLATSFYLNYILCSLMVIYLANRKSLPFISKKFDLLMGDYSYPIYLIHFQIGILVMLSLNYFELKVQAESLTLLTFSLPIIFIFAWILSKTVESPIEQLRKQIKR